MPSKQMNLSDAVIILCGVGGVGKTSIAQTLQEKWKASIFPSVTREVHHAYGLAQEKDAANLPEAEFDILQAKIRKAYVERGHDFLRANPTGVLIFERSIFDYTSYRASRQPFQTQDAYLEMLKTARAFFLDPCVLSRKVYMFHLPFPVEWSTEDEFRLSPFTKNLQWELMLKLHLQLIPTLSPERPLIIHELDTKLNVEMRTRSLLAKVTQQEWRASLDNPGGANEH